MDKRGESMQPDTVAGNGSEATLLSKTRQWNNLLRRALVDIRNAQVLVPRTSLALQKKLDYAETLLTNVQLDQDNWLEPVAKE